MEGVAGRGLVRRVNYQPLAPLSVAWNAQWVAVPNLTDVN